MEIMKKIFIAVSSVVLLGMSSCSGWTEPESKVFEHPTPQQRAGYAEYLKSLWEYKASDHKVMMVTVEGTSEAPSRQNQRLTSMADSVDFICMTGKDRLHPAFVREIAQVNDKGTSVLFVVDYTSIENEWIQLHTNADGVVAEAASDPAAFAAFCSEQADTKLYTCNEYGFNGVQVSYLGNTSQPTGESGQRAFMERVAEWRALHKDKLMVFRGYVHTLLDKSPLAECDYIVLLAGTASSNNEMTLAVQNRISEGVPTDRFILEVAIPSVYDPVQVGATPQAAADWVNIESSRFTKAGLAVANARDDYFNSVRIYNNIREAIAKMNTAEPTEPIE